MPPNLPYITQTWRVTHAVELRACVGFNNIEENWKITATNGGLYSEFPVCLSLESARRMNESWKHLWKMYVEVVKCDCFHLLFTRQRIWHVHANGRDCLGMRNCSIPSIAVTVIPRFEYTTIACAFWSGTYCMVSYPLTVAHTHAQQITILSRRQ